MEANRYPPWLLRVVTAIESRLARSAVAVVVPGASRGPAGTASSRRPPIVLPNLRATGGPPARAHELRSGTFFMPARWPTSGARTFWSSLRDFGRIFESRSPAVVEAPTVLLARPLSCRISPISAGAPMPARCSHAREPSTTAWTRRIRTATSPARTRSTRLCASEAVDFLLRWRDGPAGGGVQDRNSLRTFGSRA